MQCAPPASLHSVDLVRESITGTFWMNSFRIIRCTKSATPQCVEDATKPIGDDWHYPHTLYEGSSQID